MTLSPVYECVRVYECTLELGIYVYLWILVRSQCGYVYMCIVQTWEKTWPQGQPGMRAQSSPHRGHVEPLSGRWKVGLFVDFVSNKLSVHRKPWLHSECVARCLFWWSTYEKQFHYRIHGWIFIIAESTAIKQQHVWRRRSITHGVLPRRDVYHKKV